MKSFLFLLLPGMMLFSGAFSQPAFRKTLERRSTGLVLNFHWLQMNDAGFSPLSYKGPGGELAIMSVRGYGNKRRHFKLGVKGDYMQNSMNLGALYLQPEFVGGLTWLTEGLSSENSLSYIGGSISATSRMYRFVDEDPDHLYWATSYTVDFQYFFDAEIGKGRKVLFELNFPVAGFASRPSEENYYSFQLPGFTEYMKRLHENFGFTTWNTMQAVNASLMMDLWRTRKMGVCIGYEFDFARFSRPEPVIYLSNSVFARMFFDVLVW